MGLCLDLCRAAALEAPRRLVHTDEPAERAREPRRRLRRPRTRQEYTGRGHPLPNTDGSDHAIILRYSRDADPSAPGTGLERWHRLVHSTAPYAGASAHAIVLDHSGNAYVTGARESASHERDVFTVKFSAAGERRWMRSWDGAAHSHDFGMHLALAGRSLYVAVNTDTRRRGTDLAVIRYDTSGRRRWVRLWDDSRHQADNVAALACDTKGGVYRAADTWPSATTQKATLIKYATAGRRAWQRGYKGVAGDGGANLSDLAVGSGTAWIAGYLSRATAVTQWYAVSHTPTGRRRWATRWDGFTNDPREARPGRVRSAAAVTSPWQASWGRPASAAWAGCSGCGADVP